MQGGTLFNLPPYTGRFDLNLAVATCTECSFTSVPSCPNDALKLGFWPGGPLKSKYLFDFLLLEMFDLLHVMQLLWGGHWQEGSAASTREDMEQLFSYLSRLDVTTKNMNAAGKTSTALHVLEG